jgi:hypothetical protein
MRLDAYFDESERGQKMKENERCPPMPPSLLPFDFSLILVPEW